MTTKEQILNEALTMFARNGFEAVSMRDIGAAVGIRESSIYKHYSGKQAIMDAIVKKAMEELDGMLTGLHVPDPNIDQSVSQYATMEFEDIATLCSNMLLKQRENEIVSKFRQLLTIEQYRNAELRQLYIEVFMERQLLYNEKVFDYLLRMNVLQGDSPKMMALQFYSPFFLLQYKFQGDEESLKEALNQHTISFLKAHLKGEADQ